jgi:hypothetical protein
MQLREEVRDEFSAIRSALQSVEGGLRGELRAVDEALRAEIRTVDEALRAEIRAVDEALHVEIRAVVEALRAEIRAGDAETRRFMRVLHEDLIERIQRLGEGLSHPSSGVKTSTTPADDRPPRRRKRTGK